MTLDDNIYRPSKYEKINWVDVTCFHYYHKLLRSYKYICNLVELLQVGHG